MDMDIKKIITAIPKGKSKYFKGNPRAVVSAIDFLLSNEHSDTIGIFGLGY